MTDKYLKDTLEIVNRKKAHVITNANELATAFGGLSKLENALMDYCVSLIKPDSNGNDDFKVKISEVLDALDRKQNGKNYSMITKAFDALRVKTNVYIKADDGIIATAVFDNTMEFKEKGYVTFRFARGITPFLFHLKNNFYWYEFRRLEGVKSKYARNMWRLFEQRRHGENRTATIKGSVEQWQYWMLGKDVTWTNTRFRQQALNVAIKELETTLSVSIELKTNFENRKIQSYEVTITDNEPHVLKKAKNIRKPKKVIQRETLPDWAKNTEQPKSTSEDAENYSNDEINAKLKELRNRKRKN